MASPDILYYSVLKGIVYFTPEGGSERDLGNCPEFELTPAVDKLDHFSSRAGVRTKDRSVAREKSLEVRLVLDEYSPENVRMALLGSEIVVGTAGSEFGIFAESEIIGSVRFVGTNSIGSQVNLTLPSVSFLPSSAQQFISEEWGTMELTGDVLYSEVNENFGTCEVIEPEGITSIMPGLIDITPVVEVVDVRGHAVTVNGLSVEAIGNLFRRFPQFRRMVETNKWDADGLLKMSDEAINAIIAASCGEAFNEQTAGYLVLSEKAELIGPIYEITMPKGPRPFVNLLVRAGVLDGAAFVMGSDTTSPLPSNSSNGTGTRKPKSTRPDSPPAG